MSRDPLPEFIAIFDDLPDPRVDRTRHHRLIDIVTIALCGVISGADTWVDIAAYGRAKEAWFRTFLALPHGIPSHDTFGRVFSLLDPVAFEERFVDWVRQSLGVTDEQVIAIDGKTVRRSHDRGKGKGPLHLISAWATETGVALGQAKVDDHDNEITALPELIDRVVMPGAVVTIDAIGCQRHIAQAIVDAGGDYLLTLKGNQRELQDHVRIFFETKEQQGFALPGVAEAETFEKGHGRLERRHCWAIEHLELLAYLDPDNRWPGLQSVAKVAAARTTGDSTHRETRYYLSSLPADAARINQVARTHWAIENQLHWVLDVAFDEDHSRIRTDYAAQNLAMMRHIALSLLKQDRATKQGIKGKRLKAAWDNDYLLHVLTQ